jgi:hypothetical protein
MLQACLPTFKLTNRETYPMSGLRPLILVCVLTLSSLATTSSGEEAPLTRAADDMTTDGDQSGNRALSLSTEVQLVVDDVLLARKSGVVRRVHACKKLPAPVLASEKPWEQALEGTDQRVYVYGTVLPEQETGRFRLWYNRGSLVLYATSADGVHWDRPELNLVDYGGSKKNNIVFPHFHSPSVVYNPRADPDRRYVMLGCGRLTDRAYYAAHSPDGLHWELYPHNPILPSSDTCTLAFDDRTGEYLAFHKRTHVYRGHRRRLVYLATSRDMQKWSEPKLVMAPDEADDAQVKQEGGLYSQFYNMSGFRYGDQFLGLVTHFRFTGPPPKHGPLQSGDDGPVDVQLVHSRDGRTWHRCEVRSPVIPNGPHDYDAGCVLGVSNGFATIGDEIWFFYSAITTTHGGYIPEKKIAIAAARWRLDGMVSLDAGTEGGEIETVPLRCFGDRLIVNAEAGGGELTVAVLDQHGRPLPGFSTSDCVSVRGDGVRQGVRWEKHERLPIAEPIRLRFTFRNARLYSFSVVGGN